MFPDPGFGAGEGLFGAVFALFPIFFIAVVGFMIFAAVKGYQESKKRKAAIAATVAMHHLGHIPEDSSRVGYFASAPFGTGDSRRARDIVWGTLAGRPFETFAYSYETHTTDAEGHRSTTTHHFQITWVPLPGPLPTLKLSSDNALLRGLTHLGARDLKVESHDFNQRWKVVADDERAGHAVLTPRMIERFLQPDVMGRTFAFEGTALMSASPQVSDLGDLQMVVSALHSIVDLVPRFLFEDRSGGQPEGLGEAV